MILGQFTIKTKLQILSSKWKKRTFRWMQSSHVNPFAFRQNNWHFLPHPSINLLSLLIMTFNELATSCHLRTCVVGAGFKPRIMGIWVNPVRKLAVVSPSYFLLRHFDLRTLSKGRPLLVFFLYIFMLGSSCPLLDVVNKLKVNICTGGDTLCYWCVCTCT